MTSVSTGSRSTAVTTRSSTSVPSNARRIGLKPGANFPANRPERRRLPHLPALGRRVARGMVPTPGRSTARGESRSGHLHLDHQRRSLRSLPDQPPRHVSPHESPDPLSGAGVVARRGESRSDGRAVLWCGLRAGGQWRTRRGERAVPHVARQSVQHRQLSGA